MIHGLQLIDLKTHADERGFFREVLRCEILDPTFSAAQLSHSLVHTGVTKGWHGHILFSQMTYFATGAAVVVFTDRRPCSPTFGAFVERLTSDAIAPWVAVHPPGVLLAYRCTQGSAHVFYATSGVYDPSDEVRIDLQDGEIVYDWAKWGKIR